MRWWDGLTRAFESERWVRMSNPAMARWFDGLKRRARALKAETYAVYLAGKDPRVPCYAKLLIAFVVVHTLSPIDLIPDFIPVLGYLDDLVIAPLGIALAIRMIPEDVLAENREKARAMLDRQPATNWVAGGIIIAIWLIAAALVGVALWRAMRD